MKKALIWVVLIVVVLWVLNQPGDAAAAIHKVTNAFTTLANSL